MNLKKIMIATLFVVPFVFGGMALGDSSIDDNSSSLLSQLRTKLNDRPNPVDKPWMENFIKSEILGNKNAFKLLTLRVCYGLPSKSDQQQCLEGSLSFENELNGAANAIDDIIKNCEQNNDSCNTYRNMLNEDLEMLTTYVNRQN